MRQNLWTVQGARDQKVYKNLKNYQKYKIIQILFPHKTSPQIKTPEIKTFQFSTSSPHKSSSAGNSLTWSCRDDVTTVATGRHFCNAVVVVMETGTTFRSLSPPKTSWTGEFFGDFFCFRLPLLILPKDVFLVYYLF